MTRAWERLGTLLLVVVSTALCLLLAEVLFRVLPAQSGERQDEDGIAYRFNPFRPDPHTAYALREGASAVHAAGAGFQVQVDVDALGLRGPERSRKPGRRTRVLLLGDSFAFGWGVEYPETFGARLERLLRSAEGPIEVLNAGVPGWSADDQLIDYERRGSALGADLVLLAETENDPQDLRWKELELDADLLPVRARSTHRLIDHRGRMRNVEGVPRLAFPGESWLRGHSYLWNAIRFRLTKLYLRHFYEQAVTSDARLETRLLGRPIGDLSPTELQQGLAASARLRLAYHRWLREHLEARARGDGAGFRRVLVTFDDQRPYEPEVIAGLHADCAATPDTCLDTRDFFATSEREPAFYPGDGHWTAFGHERVAQRLAAWLADQPTLGLQAAATK